MTSPEEHETTGPQAVIAVLRAELDAALADKVALADALAAKSAELATRNTEYDERIEYQSATSDVLKAMSGSPGDPQPVFDLIVRRARDLCDAYGVTVYEFDGKLVHYRAATGVSDDPEVQKAIAARYPMLLSRDMFPHRAILDCKLIRIDDLQSEPGLSPIYQTIPVKSAVSIPLVRGDATIGALAMGSRERGGFTDVQIELLKTFAEQAVIAIENARLFNEVQAKTRDLEESLQQQTATADVLKVISRSAFDLQTVLETLLDSAVELSGALRGTIFLRDGDLFRFRAASYDINPAWLNFLKDNPQRAGRHSAVGRAIATGQTICVPDMAADPEIDIPAYALAGTRAVLATPLLRDGQVEGAMALVRTTPGPFTQRQIELVQTFADQAVIAIENARLFNEVQAKTRDLTEALQQQTATAEVLKVISRSTFDLPAVLQALVETAARLCNADKGAITRQKDGMFYRAESFGFSEDFMNYVRGVPVDRHSATGRALYEGVVVHIPDVEADRDYTFKGQRLGDFRAVLGVPMLREGAPIGVITLTRTEPEEFTDKQIELAITFADQAAIAIENVRLFDEVQERTRELSQSLDDLRKAQDRLIQTEKLASLGQLTAGIAHEIKNPLNFVNNFSALSAELTDELNETLKTAALNEKLREEVNELTKLLKENLEKVVQHGKRADSIVKNMLLHSREGSREQRPTDVNALVDESLNLAYHGARAEKSGFEITLQRDFDANAGTAELFPQEINRALLNLLSNGFYAATKRKAENGGAGAEPTVLATTKNLGSSVEIRIRDNGAGIPPEVGEKMFNPFFTTKPTGEGTGLGLSMTHDIVVKQHGGRIDVETKLGEFTEFIITLPRDNRLAAGEEPE